MIENPILSLAVIFVVGFFFSRFIKKLKIPTITAYIALGILLSPGFLNVISSQLFLASEVISNIVLGIIAFSLGESFSVDIFRRVGKSVVSISIAAALAAWLLVGIAFWAIFNQSFYIAFIFGAIAAATAPAAVVMVVQEYRSKGEFTDTLLGIVAIDDAWFSILPNLPLHQLKSALLVLDHDKLCVFAGLLHRDFDLAGSDLWSFEIQKLAHLVELCLSHAQRHQLSALATHLTLCKTLSAIPERCELLACVATPKFWRLATAAPIRKPPTASAAILV